jgi:hypothetical protein
MDLRCAVVAIVTLFCGVASASAQGRATCELAITARAPEAKLTGPEEVLTRLHLLKQIDAPVAVVAADFSDARLVVGGGSATFEGPYDIDVVNLSSTSLDEVHVQVAVRSQNGSFGRGVRWQGQLPPGMSTRISHRSIGRGQGTAPDDVVELVISIERVRFAGCDYRPGKVLPPVGK